MSVLVVVVHVLVRVFYFVRVMWHLNINDYEFPYIYFHLFQKNSKKAKIDLLHIIHCLLFSFLSFILINLSQFSLNFLIIFPVQEVNFEIVNFELHKMSDFDGTMSMDSLVDAIHNFHNTQYINENEENCMEYIPDFMKTLINHLA